MKTDLENKYICSFCAQIGEIVLPDVSDRVENTAASELRSFFAGFPLTGKGKLIAGRLCNNEFIRALSGRGVLKIGEVLPEDDGYELRSVGEDIIVAGANARGVLHGIFALEDLILGGKTNGFETFVVPYFRKRSDAIGHYHSISVNLGNDTLDAKKAEYLARLGVNQFCACFDCSPFGSHLLDLVKSDVFPFQRDPNPEAVRRVKELSSTCADYGIEFNLMLWEPSLPASFAPIESYPPEALGQVHRPWGGDANNMDVTLCVSSTIVQEHYRNVIGKFVAEYKDVAGFFFYNLDGSSWLCTPKLCPRCADKLIDSDPSAHNPWETQANFVTLICDAAHAVRPDFKINFWNPIHYHGDAVRKMYDTAKGYDYVTTGWEGSDHDLYVTFPEQPCDEVCMTREAAEKYNAPMYIYFAYNRLEAIQIGFPSPFTVAQSIQTFKRWGAHNLMEVTGPTPALNQINALVMKRFESEPDTEIEPFLHELAEKQFGKEAGEYMYRAWEHTRDAFDAWKHYEAAPLCGSQFIMRVSSYYGKVSEIILPSVLDEFDNFYFKTLTNVEPWKRPFFEQNKTPEFIERFVKMGECIEHALDAARAAVAVASEDEKIGLCYYEGGFESIGCPTMKEYALLNLSSIEQAYAVCLQRIDMLRAIALLRTMRDGSKEEAQRAQVNYLSLLSHDIELQRQYEALLCTLLHRRPCFTLTGICESELRMYLAGTRDKIHRLEEYLKEQL